MVLCSGVRRTVWTACGSGHRTDSVRLLSLAALVVDIDAFHLRAISDTTVARATASAPASRRWIQRPVRAYSDGRPRSRFPARSGVGHRADPCTRRGAVPADDAAASDAALRRHGDRPDGRRTRERGARRRRHQDCDGKRRWQQLDAGKKS